uniref:Uncharacterized protein n=1 Tax=Lepeophtheirus salmonis TaxID=72036 RepID=A0A0K2TL08_LEPSM
MLMEAVVVGKKPHFGTSTSLVQLICIIWLEFLIIHSISRNILNMGK